MNTQYDSRTADKFVVRLPDGLRNEVQGAADHLDTSMNTVFVQAVRQYLDNQKRQQLLLDALAAKVSRRPTYDETKERQLFERLITVESEEAGHGKPDLRRDEAGVYQQEYHQAAWAGWIRCAQSRAKAREVGRE